MSDAKIVIITGGSFNGKSTVAIQIAARLGFAGVIPVDSIRNTLKITYPKREYFSTSIYMLPEQQIYNKIEDVSVLTEKMITLYKNRGEHVIFEGIHWSEEIFGWIAANNFCRICLVNRLPLEKRVVLKNSTRSKLRYEDIKTGKQRLGKLDASNIHSSTYIKKKDKINKHQNFLIKNAIKNDFKIIKFDKLKLGVEEAIDWVRLWYEK